MKLSKRLLSIVLCVLMITTSVPMLVLQASASLIVLDLLENDDAYLSAFGVTRNEDTVSGYSINTGNMPFDANDEPGNDSSALNNVVRTFDSITYETYFQTKLNPETFDRDISGFKEGSIYFEYILPCTSSEAIFETNSMGWLETAPNIVYEIVEDTFNGKPCQILRGSYLLTPNSSNPSAIGSSYNTLNVVTRILDMKNGEKFQPVFSMWLYANDVGTTYHGKYAGIPSSIVYGTNHVCEEHDRQEYSSFVAPPTIVSSAPRYNVQIAKATAYSNIALGTFDFSTGNETAANKDAGNVYGRMFGFGITLQLLAETTSKGMMGMELPDVDTDIKFDLKIATTYTKGVSTVVPTEAIDDGYQVLFWGGQENSDTTKLTNGRVTKTATNVVVNNTPYNKDTNGVYNIDTDYRYCKDGGTWNFEVDEEDPTIIHVTVSGYEVDLNSLPYTYVWGDKTTYTYYNPNQVKEEYWKIPVACISSGKAWVVQPYTNYLEESGVKDMHIKDYYGSGTVNTSMEDIKLDMTSISGKTTLKLGQAKTTDDKGVFDYPFENPGSYDARIRYTQYKKGDVALTENCYRTNADWAVSGQKISIQSYVYSDGTEGPKSSVAMSSVIKFDDAFFEPESSSLGTAKSTATYTPNTATYWGAKADKSGWDHKGLKPDESGYDDEMNTLTADDLVWFSSLAELREQGYTPVAVLFERIGLASTSNGGYDRMVNYVHGKIKDDCEVHYAYETSHEVYMWTKDDVVGNICEELDLTYAEVTDAVYSQYVKSSSFYTRASGTKLAESMIKPTGMYSNPATTSAYISSVKAQYEDGLYVYGSGADHYIDSCYIVPFKTTISKNIAQTTQNGVRKKVYDMGQNQRVVDFVLNPKIERVGGEGTSNLDDLTTTVTVTDILPAGLTYIVGSSYYDKDCTATYTSGKNCQTAGSVTGAESITPTITKNADGSTTIVYVLKDIVIDPNISDTDLGLIYLSATIGTPGVEETDVMNQQQFENVATVYSDKDINRELILENGNYATTALEVLKQTGISLVKLADSDVIDKGQPIGYNLFVGNNDGHKIYNVVIVESLPHDGDSRGSKFHGEVYVTKFAAAEDDRDYYSSFSYYYTKNTDYRDLDSSDFATNGDNKEWFESHSEWIKLELSEGDLKDGLFSNLPLASEQKGEDQIVAIVAVGDLDAGHTLKLRVELAAPDTDTGDRLVNTLSRGDLISYAASVVVQRNLSGKTWVDSNANDVIDEDEERLDGVVVELFIKDEDGEYIPYTTTDPDGNVIEAIIETGKKIDLATGEIEDYKPGEYLFECLPEGTYKVVFNGEESVMDIVLPEAHEIKGGEIYNSDTNHIGLTKTSITMTKIWEDKDDLDKMRAPYGVTLCADGVPVREEVILQPDELTYTWNDLPLTKNGKLIEYTLLETTVPDGYEPVYEGLVLTNVHNPDINYIPVIFFAPDNINYRIADGITFYSTSDGKGKRVSNNTMFKDSTTIYVERGTVISFQPAIYFSSWSGDYVATIKMGDDETLSVPHTVKADENGWFTFRASDSYSFIMMSQFLEDPDTGEAVPWYQFLLDIIKKIADFFKKLFG